MRIRRLVLFGFGSVALALGGGLLAGGDQLPPVGAPSFSQEQPRPAQHEVPDDPPARRADVAPTGWTTAPPDSRGPAIQVNVNAQGNNIPGDAANEPSIAVDPTNPNNLVIGWRQFDTVASNFREAGYAYSHDAGRTWTFPGVLQNGVFRSDPVVEADPDGNFYYYSLTSSGGNFTCQMFESTNKGHTWIGPVQAFGGDKNWMAIDQTNGIGRRNIYCDWSPFYSSAPGFFTRSTDGGQTYLQPITVPLNPYWGTIAVGPDGEVYVAGAEFSVSKSTNAKNPAAAPTFDLSVPVSLGGTIIYGGAPNPVGLAGQAWVDVDRSSGPTRGYVYLLCSVDPAGTDPADVMFARSTDGGQSWSTPRRINDDPPGTNAWQWFGTMSVAPNGRIDVIWNDTRESGQANLSRLYYSYSADGGVNWSANVALTPPFDSHLGWPNQNKLGDYYDMVSDNVGANLAVAATFNNEQDVYFLRIGEYDCNGNGVPDPQDISSGTSPDLNHNGIPDECDGLGDLNCDGAVNAFDIDPFVLALTNPAQYQQQYPNCQILRADINGDGVVNAFDIDPFVTLLTWP